MYLSDGLRLEEADVDAAAEVTTENVEEDLVGDEDLEAEDGVVDTDPRQDQGDDYYQYQEDHYEAAANNGEEADDGETF